MNSFEIRKKAKNEIKSIVIRDETNGENEIDMDILPTKTVKYLKNQIEEKFNLKIGTLQKIRLRMQKKGERVGTLLDKDNNTLFDYRIQDGAVITFMVMENIGGKLLF